MKRTVAVLFFFFLTVPMTVFAGPRITLQYPTGGRIVAAAYDSGRHVLYAVSEDRYLYALSDRGKQIWRYAMGDSGSPVLSIGPDHTIYAGTKQHYLVAVNPYGKKIWRIKLDSSIRGNVVSGKDGTIYTVTVSGSLYGISHRGIIRYRVSLPAPPVLAPLLNNSFLFVPCINNRLYAFDTWGALKWIFLFSGRILSAVCTGERVYGGTSSGTVAAVTMEGKKRWSTVLHAPVSSIVLSDSGTLFCNAGKNITSLNSQGSIQWVYQGKEHLKSLAVLGEWIVTDNTAGILSFYALNGKQIGLVRAGKPSVPLLYTSRGEIVVGSKDWNIYYAGYPSTVIAQFDRNWPLVNGRCEGNRSISTLTGRPSFEDLHNLSNDFIYLKALSDSYNAVTLSHVLDTIKARIETEHYDSGKEFFLQMLEYLASDCITRPYRRNNILVNNFTVIRGRADALLGREGDFKTQKILVNLLNYEWDPYVIREIITSIGLLGYNPENETIKALYTYYNANRSIYGEGFRKVVVEAVSNIYHYTGVLGNEGVRLVLKVFKDSSSKPVREDALELLYLLKK